MKQVYVAAHPLDAELVKGFLESHGIEAVVRGDAVFALRGEVPMTTDTLPTVWVVDDGAVARARALIDEHHRGPESGSEKTASWKCPKCGEPLESQFTTCWQCGAARPGFT